MRLLHRLFTSGMKNPDIRSPLRFLWNTRIPGGYLQFRVVLFVASLLAVGGAVLALKFGGVAGILTLSGLIFFTLVALSVVFKFH